MSEPGPQKYLDNRSVRLSSWRNQGFLTLSPYVTAVTREPAIRISPDFFRMDPAGSIRNDPKPCTFSLFHMNGFTMETMFMNFTIAIHYWLLYINRLGWIQDLGKEGAPGASH
jgi:hypothetical protein